METLNLNLLETMNLKPVCYTTALQQFYCGKEVYAKITDTLWIQTHNETDVSFELNKNLEFYVQNGYDEDKLIVTRHDVIEDFFRKEMGINARRVLHARPYELKGKHVYGMIPLSLMPYAETVTVVHSRLRNDLVESPDMTLEEFTEGIITVKRYKVYSEVMWGSENNEVEE